MYPSRRHFHGLTEASTSPRESHRQGHGITVGRRLASCHVSGEDDAAIAECRGGVDRHEQCGKSWRRIEARHHHERAFHPCGRLGNAAYEKNGKDFHPQQTPPWDAALRDVVRPGATADLAFAEHHRSMFNVPMQEHIKEQSHLGL